MAVVEDLESRPITATHKPHQPLVGREAEPNAGTSLYALIVNGHRVLLP
jgi:hypothetical protein